MTKKFTFINSDGFPEEAIAYTTDEFIDSSAGAADAGKPVVLDADGQIDDSMINDADIAHDSTGGAAASTVHTAFPLLDGTRPYTGPQSMGSNKITNLANGTASNDAVNYGQLLAVQTNRSWKDPVQLIAISDVDLTGEQTIDGTLTSSSRVAVVGNSPASENGIYITSSGAWTRATDADEDAEVVAGMVFIVSEGTTYKDTEWQLTTDDPIVVGTTALTFQRMPTEVTTASLGVERVVNNFQLDLLSGGGLKLTGNEVGVEPNDFAGDGLVDDGADNLAVDWATDFTIDAADAKAFKASDIASTSNGAGASIVGVEDSAGYFDNDNVEDILAELYATAIKHAGVEYTVGTGGVTAGHLVYISANNTVVEYATLTQSHRGIGLALTTESAAADVIVAANDTVAEGVLTGATAGTPYYWDGSALVTTIPTGTGSHVWQAGVAKNATDLHVEVRFIKVNA